MAATAVCEQYAIELSEMGDKAKHIVPHSLHPTAAATNFMTRRTADGNKTTGDEFKNFIKGNGGSTAIDIVGGLFNGLVGGEYYILLLIIQMMCQLENKLRIVWRIKLKI